MSRDEIPTSGRPLLDWFRNAPAVDVVLALVEDPSVVDSVRQVLSTETVDRPTPAADQVCDLCKETTASLFLSSTCHPLAPLRAIKEGSTLILRCYLPTCDREVARLELVPTVLVEHPTIEQIAQSNADAECAAFDAARARGEKDED